MTMILIVLIVHKKVHSTYSPRGGEQRERVVHMDMYFSRRDEMKCPGGNGMEGPTTAAAKRGSSPMVNPTRNPIP